MCLSRLFFLFPLWYKKYKSKMSVTLEPVQTEIAAEPIAEEIPEVNAENTAEIQNPIPEVEEVVPDVPEAIPETVQPKNAGDPRRWQQKKQRNQYQKSSHNETTLRKQRRRQIKS